MKECIHNKEVIYNVWEAPRNTKRYKNELLRFYQIVSHIKTDVNSAMDLGCGTGYMSNLLADSGIQVTAVDISDERLSICKKKVDRKDVEILKQDIFEYQEKQFDLIVCQEVIEHIENYNLLVDKIWSLLNSGGSAIITTPYNENLGAKTKKCDICG